MTPEEWKLVNQLFHHALAIDAETRAGFIDQNTRNLPTVRHELLSLLNSHSEAGEFLEAPPLPSRPMGDQAGRSLHAAYFEAGSRTGDFLILSTLGQGAFATVYLAQQLSLNRQVALKVSPNFGEEARTMAPLEHDNIVKVFSESVEPTQDLRLLCMQHIPGTTLERVLSRLTENLATESNETSGAQWLSLIDQLNTVDASFIPTALRDRERLSRYDDVEAIVWIGVQLADALAYAHERNILHLDVKPGNVLLTPYGRPMLTDFNIAVHRNLDGSAPTVLGGTLNYMAPEHRRLFDQVRNCRNEATQNLGTHSSSEIRIDSRADIYSLGVLLREVAEKTKTRLTLEDQLPQILNRCTEQSPERRFSSAVELRDALEGCLELRSIHRALPPAGRLTHLAEQYSWVALILLSVVPQLIGSAVNITYNEIFIVRNLSAAQQAVFRDLVLLYNAILYPLCLAWGIRELLPLRQCFRGSPTQGDIDALRARVLALPLRIVAIFTLGWMPGSLFFPLAIHLIDGPLPPAVFENFFISFALSWLIALSYSCLYVQYVAVRVMYPRLWWGKRQIQSQAHRELASWSASLRFFQFLAAFVPLIGAALVVFVGPSGLSGRDYRLFQGLVTGLLAVGMLGLVYALKASQLLSATIYAFTGREPGCR